MSDPRTGACPADEVLVSLAGSEVPGVERTALEAHLTTCDRCRATVRTYRALGSGLRDLGNVPMSAELRPRLMQALEKEAANATGPRRSAFNQWTALLTVVTTACLVLALVFPLFIRAREAARVSVATGTAAAPTPAAPASPPAGGSGAPASDSATENAKQSAPSRSRTWEPQPDRATWEVRADTAVLRRELETNFRATVTALKEPSPAVKGATLLQVTLPPDQWDAFLLYISQADSSRILADPDIQDPSRPVLLRVLKPSRSGGPVLGH